MDIEKPQKAVREIVTNVEEEEPSVVEERSKFERSVVVRLTSPCMQQLESALKENRSLEIALMQSQSCIVAIKCCVPLLGY